MQFNGGDYIALGALVFMVGRDIYSARKRVQKDHQDEARESRDQAAGDAITTANLSAVTKELQSLRKMIEDNTKSHHEHEVTCAGFKGRIETQMTDMVAEQRRTNDTLENHARQIARLAAELPYQEAEVLPPNRPMGGRRR